MFGLAIPLLFSAAILESFVRESTLSTQARLWIAGGLAALLVAGLAFLRRLALQRSPRAGWLAELGQTDS